MRSIALALLTLIGACNSSDEPRASERGVPGQQPRPGDHARELELATVDLPKDPPFVGGPGVDAHGYPLAQPDKVALLNLLRLRRFDELDRFVAHYQDQFEADFRKEYWPEFALSAFFSDDPKIGELLQDWIESSPNSFAAYAARGNHRFRLAQERRGSKFASETSSAQLQAMAEALDHAETDFLEALKHRPKCAAAQLRVLQIADMRGDDELERKRLDEALTQCPNCYIPRAKYLDASTPRWGGSHELMRAFARESTALVAENSRLALLEGFVAWDECRTALGSKQYPAAHQACSAALAFGAESRFLVSAAEVHFGEDNFTAALPVLDRLLAFDPFHTRGLELRHAVRLELHDTLGAGRDLLVLRHTNPLGAGRAERVEHMLDKLRYDGHQLSEAGKHVEAAEFFSLGLQLAPNDQDMMTREAMNQKQIGFAAAQAQLAAAPDDFALHLRVDHGLAASDRYADVAKIWDTFIAGHETDPRPYVERAGAKWHLDKHGEAIADMDQACQLGLERACADVERMRARARK